MTGCICDSRCGCCICCLRLFYTVIYYKHWLYIVALESKLPNMHLHIRRPVRSLYPLPDILRIAAVAVIVDVTVVVAVSVTGCICDCDCAVTVVYLVEGCIIL